MDIFIAALLTSLAGWLIFRFFTGKVGFKYDPKAIYQPEKNSNIKLTEIDKHKYFIKQRFEVPPYVAKELNKENLAAIEKYGSWMKALEMGEIKPITEEQNRFLDVCRAFQTPSNK